MILKSLELVGFKSFGQPTRLDFTQGFTAIVGPNGCGKSNISDAIRWVIGEQNSRTLRGQKLTDLIFNGSETRKAVNRAEINLILSRVPQGLRIANVPHIGEEIKITRCYHRSGESEYYINQVPCRLKDIVDLFLDLGISSRSMTIIEQNHIHEIITAKAEERRQLIEEAAGILKFKHRKHEALLKLTASQQNLFRISDIVQELGRQSESLKRQAAKADRYKRYQAEIKDLQLNLSAQKIRRFQKELKTTEGDFNRYQEQKAQLEAKNSTLEIDIEHTKIEMEEKERSLQQKKENVHQLSLEISKQEHTIELKQSQIQAAEEDTAAANSEIGIMAQEVTSLIAEADLGRSDLGNISQKIDVNETDCEQKNKTLNTLRESIKLQEEAGFKMEEAVKALYLKESHKKNEKAALEARNDFLKSQGEKLKRQLDETLENLKEAQQGVSDTETLLASKTNQFQSIKAEHDACLETLEESRLELKKQEQCVDAAKETFLSRSSFLQSIQELRQKFEGYQDGVKALMSNTNGDRLPGLREVLVDIVHAPEEYEPALEAVLGNRLQSVIVNSYTDTVRAIDYLKSNQSGRSSFIPLNPKSQSQSEFHLNGNPAVLGKMIDKIECHREYQPLMNHLIGNVVLVRDLQTALDLYAKPEFQGVVVTSNGEVIDDNGIVSGGQNMENGSSLLSQKREIETLFEEVDSLRKALHVANQKMENLSTDLSHQEERLGTLRPALRESELEQTDCRHALEQMQIENDRLKQKQTTLEFERSNGELENQELSKEEAALQEVLESIVNEKNSSEERLSDLRRECNASKSDLESQNETLNTLLVLLASLKGKRDSLLLEIKRLNLQTENLSQRVNKRQEDQKSNAARIQELEQSIKNLEETILQSVRKKDQWHQEALDEEEGLQEDLRRLKANEMEAKQTFKELQEISEALSKIEIKRSEIKIQSAHLEEQAYSDFSVSLGELLDQYRQTLDETETTGTLITLKDKLDKMGEVNLAALTEYQETNARYTFLNRQQEDLAESIRTLNAAIEKINNTIQQRFLDTFHQVNDYFSKIYGRLFEGGKASLVMSNDNTPLESGIEIHAQPLGKKMQNLALLSGGEKAMTAIALIFSLLKVRPTPFCLLDEVDAPLDEPNVVRFQTMLQELADDTQFIIITHNQKTMSFADALYGITMEERGVSKAVSVNLN